MDQKELFKQMIDFNKTTFDNSFNAMVMLQEQTERMVNMSLEQATWLPEEGRKVIKEWINAYKTGCQDFKRLIDTTFGRVEDFFASSEK